MDEQKKSPKRGRPPKFIGAEERVARSLRMMPNIEVRIREAAESNHRSIAEELEFRINQSFEGIVIRPSRDTMDELLSSARSNERTIEEEVIRRISESQVAEIVKSALLSADFVQKQASIITDFMRQQRIGIIIGRLLARETDRPAPPSSKENDKVEDHIQNRALALKKMENEFEKLFGIGAINSLVEKYDEEVLSLVHEASKGKYMVISGRMQEVKIDPVTNSAMAVFTGEDATETAHLPRRKSPKAG